MQGKIEIVLDTLGEKIESLTSKIEMLQWELDRTKKENNELKAKVETRPLVEGKGVEKR